MIKKLAFDLYLPSTNSNLNKPIVILHGLFGSKDNWRSLSKALAERTRTPILTCDLRNHGDSFWDSHPFTYQTMANDVIQLLSEKYGNSLESVDVIGHSMGAKVAMNVSSMLFHKDLIRKLIVVDMSSKSVPISQTFIRYIECMSRIDKMGLKKRSEVEKLLYEIETKDSVVKFLAKNFVPFHKLNPSAREMLANYGSIEDSLGLRCRVNLDCILKSVDNFKHDFSSPHGITTQTLVIYGTQADYVKEEDKVHIKHNFPNARFEGVESGHWVHSEKPNVFMELVTDFIKNV